MVHNNFFINFDFSMNIPQKVGVLQFLKNLLVAAQQKSKAEYIKIYYNF